ncbi:MAG: hypothetical protein WDW38_010861 [Sanguina aurantia]
MLAFYTLLLVVLCAIAGLLLLSQANQSVVPAAGPQVSAFVKLRNNYVLVYALMMAGDWLQGPYVYALYEYYGYDVKDIGRLFIAGFGSSMVVGTVVGALADKYGRKKAGLLYVFLYSLSCATKHSSRYEILMLGRLLGALPPLCSSQPSSPGWSLSTSQRGLKHAGLETPSRRLCSLGNGLVAILAGLFANFLVESLSLGPVAPFDASAAVLLAGGAVIWLTWPENYGDRSGAGGLVSQFRMAAAAVSSDQRIALLGAEQSLFEASMYTFVFLWTPALSPNGEKIPHGLIFACFMTASMVGSALSATLMKRGRVESYMKFVFAASAAALAVPFFVAFFIGEMSAAEKAAAKAAGDVGLSGSGKIQLIAFCVFEVLVGVFWPSMMTMRSAYIPEELRSTILNTFRVPLNFFVCVILYNVQMFSLSAMFALCSAFLVAATLCQMQLEKISMAPVVKGMPESESFMGRDPSRSTEL